MQEQQRLHALHREREVLEQAMLEGPTKPSAGSTNPVAGAQHAASSGKLSFGLKRRNALS
jgi:hypothetical protein